jgi:hypothetical protein
MKRLWKLFVICILLFSPVFGFLGMAGYFFYALGEYNGFNEELPYFYQDFYLKTFENPNYTQLYNKSIWHGYFQRTYHLPLDTIADVVFFPNNTPRGYDGKGDSPIWTGYFLASEAFRYAVTKNDSALNSIKRAALGLQRLITISGEPGYLVRFAVPKNETYLTSPLWYDFFSTSNRFDVVYQGENWTYEDRTSRDQNIGIMFGFGIVYDLLKSDLSPKAQEICQIIKTNVELVLDYFIKVDWIVVDVGGQSKMGADFKSGMIFTGPGSVAILAFLKVGELVNPTKYGPLYYDYAVRRGWADQTYDWNDMNVNWQYYSFNLNHATFFTLLRLEKDPILKAIYQKAYDQSLWRLIKYHRNAFFNLLYLIVHDIYDVNATVQDGMVTLCPWNDTLDSLLRYPEAPRRSWTIINSNRTLIHPESGQNVSLVDPKSVNWAETYGIKNLDFFFEPVGFSLSEEFKVGEHALFALPLDERPVSDFQWQRSPFDLDSYGDGSWESPAMDYTLIYWMARYYDFLPSVITANLSIISNLGIKNASYLAEINTNSSKFNVTLENYGVEWAATWYNSSQYQDSAYNVTIYAINATDSNSIQISYLKLSAPTPIPADASIYLSNNPVPTIAVVLIAVPLITVIFVVISYKIRHIKLQITRGGK